MRFNQSAALHATMLATCTTFSIAYAATPMVAGGFFHSAVLMSNGSVYTWGANAKGQVGNSTFAKSATTKNYPTQALITDVTQISIGDDETTTLALRKDGTAWIWGYRADAVNTNGLAYQSYEPVQIPNLTGLTAVAAGSGFGIALKSDGTVWSWGTGGDGQLGDGTTPSGQIANYTPRQVKTLTGVTKIAACQAHALAIKSDGTVWAWGNNNIGQLGQNTNQVDKSTPVQVPGLTGASAVSCGTKFSVVAKSDGTVWVFGNNFNYEYGNGTQVEAANYAPTQVPGLSDVKMVAASEVTLLALKNDGTVWGWGDNARGQVGSGKTTTSGTDIRVPTQVSGLSGISHIARGYNHSLAVKSDGTVYAWGWNDYGQLGDNQPAAGNAELVRYTPVQPLGIGGSGTLSAVNSNLLGFPVSAAYDGALTNLSLTLYFSPNSADKGKSGKVFLAAILPSGDVYLSTSKGFVKYTAGAALSEFASITSLGTGFIPILGGTANATALAGTTLFLGYGSDANDMLANGRLSTVYTIK